MGLNDFMLLIMMERIGGIPLLVMETMAAIIFEATNIQLTPYPVSLHTAELHPMHPRE